VELFEVKEDLALDLQICDNSPTLTPLFISNPSGKFKIKSREMARAAMAKITQHWT
jgi:hypothetical protein